MEGGCPLDPPQLGCGVQKGAPHFFAIHATEFMTHVRKTDASHFQNLQGAKIAQILTFVLPPSLV